MTALRLVSIRHPCLTGSSARPHLGLLPDTEVTVLTPHDCSVAPVGSVRRVSIQATGRQSHARFPALAAALALLEPDVVHLQAEPDSRLAWQVARLCGPSHGRGLVLETEAGAALPGFAAARRARRTLARTQAVLGRSALALTQLRRLGFDGLGLVVGRGLGAMDLPDPDTARRLLHIDRFCCPVIGWAGSTDASQDVANLLEAVALMQTDVVIVIPADGPAYQDVLDRADALEVLHRIRMAAPAGTTRFAPRRGRRKLRPEIVRPDLAGFPTLLAAADILLVPPAANGADHAASVRAAELGQVHGLPLIHAGTPEIAEFAGAAGWQVAFADPALLARLLDRLQAWPDLRDAAASAAVAAAQARHSPQAAACALARAIAAAAPKPRHAFEDAWPLSARIGLNLQRQPINQ